MPSIVILLGDSSKSLVSVVLNLPGELLSGKFLLISMKADGVSSVEVSFSADSFVPSYVSVPISKSSKKLKSRLHIPPNEALSSYFPPPPDRDPAAWVLPIYGTLPPYHFVSDFSLNSKGLALHSLSRLETLIRLACQLTCLLLLRALS